MDAFTRHLAASVAVLWVGYQLARAFRELRARLDQRRYGIAWWLNLLTVGCLTVGPVIVMWM